MTATDYYEGMARVERGTDPDWRAHANEVLYAYLLDHETMFVDDLWDAGLTEPRELRALGPIFGAAVRSGWMVKSGSYRPSTRSNMTEKPVWRSLVARSVIQTD